MSIQNHTQNNVTTNIFRLYLVILFKTIVTKITKLYQTKPNTHSRTHLNQRIYIHYCILKLLSILYENSYILVVNKIQY